MESNNRPAPDVDEGDKRPAPDVDESDYLARDQHRRYNPLTGEWVLVSPHRIKRPWQGRVEKRADAPLTQYDPQCYLCPGNTRANGETNPPYRAPISFINDYAALRQDARQFAYNREDVIVAESEYGVCKVLCYAPEHNLHIGAMEDARVVEIINLWDAETRALAADPQINHIQIFENRGAMMGASNPHPHGQLWAQSTIPFIARRKAKRQRQYTADHRERLLLNYVAQERTLDERIICQNDYFVWLVPFWAVWPYETMIIATRPRATIGALEPSERLALAQILKRAIQTYDRVFDCSFAYSMGIHQAPLAEEYQDSWQFHIGFYPPLLRSATVRKFMVGYELCAMPQRDISAESVAATLKTLCQAPTEPRDLPKAAHPPAGEV